MCSLRERALFKKKKDICVKHTAYAIYCHRNQKLTHTLWKAANFEFSLFYVVTGKLFWLDWFVSLLVAFVVA